MMRMRVTACFFRPRTSRFTRHGNPVRFDATLDQIAEYLSYHGSRAAAPFQFTFSSEGGGWFGKMRLQGLPLQVSP